MYPLQEKQINDMSKGLYDPQFEHDSCGVGCITNFKGIKSHAIVKDALTMLENMEHRGATGSDPDTGDGAGILIQIPHDFLEEQLQTFGIPLPQVGLYGVGMVFYPQHYATRELCRKVINDCMTTMNFKLITYRLVPTDANVPGHESKSVEPYIEQLFLVHEDDTIKGDDLERKLFVLGNYITHQINNYVQAANDEFYIASLSCNTLIYKGQLKTDQLRSYYHDLQNESFTSALAIVHSRFSTNTFPNWKLAQPFRYIAHNGEINTIRGNVTKMRSKEALMHSEYFSSKELSYLMPITDPNNSDSANLDGLVELLTLSGRSLPHVMMMLVPEAWQGNKQMDANRKDFYKYHAAMMEPWDGPAALFFTNGKQIGATLDRNGLRPARYCITSDHRLIMASEAGAIVTDEAKIIKKGRLQPGKMFLIDFEKGRMDQMTDYTWLTDGTISDGSWSTTGSWSHTEELDIKASKTLLHILIDIVSKNGNFLLNISPTADGIIPEAQQKSLLEMGVWLRANGEAIYGTRPFVTYGEGPKRLQGGGHFVSMTKPYDDENIRYTTKGNNIYAIQMGWAGSKKEVLLTTFAKEKLGKTKIEQISVVDSSEKIAWKMTEAGLQITTPFKATNKKALVFKIETKNGWKTMKSDEKPLERAVIEIDG